MIGGLLVATFATLLFVPCVFALLHQKRSTVGEVPMKRRTLLIVGLPVVLVAALLLSASWSANARSRALTRVATEQAVVPVQVISAAARARDAPAGAAGNGARLVRGADFRAGLRLRAAAGTRTTVRP